LTPINVWTAALAYDGYKGSVGPAGAREWKPGPHHRGKEHRMDDSYERRALLLHLGGVLQTTSLLMEHERGDETLAELIEAQPLLADVPLLEYSYQQMTVRELATAALRAFCLWPQLLLEAPLDRAALAASVREHLFRDNAQGWSSYAAALQSEVAWFGKPAVANGRRNDGNGDARRSA
jgi:hypothetical protein